jgi:uncharacterized cupredoxin-like copper-binding protein
MSYRAAFLLLVVAVAAEAQPATNTATSVDWSNAQVIEIRMTNYDFTPKALQFRMNTPYRLHFVNSASKDHNFTSKELFAAVMVAPEDRAKIENGEIEVGMGKSVDVAVMPLKAGTYPFHCSHFLHSSFGMHGQANIGA